MSLPQGVKGAGRSSRSNICENGAQNGFSGTNEVNAVGRSKPSEAGRNTLAGP
jgi:hypothetical protein